ncbi:MAG: fimbrial protein [Pseudomonas sp.]
MIKTLAALSLGLASSTAYASTGSIHFYGQVHAGTCQVVIIDPENGNPINRIGLGNVSAAEFKQIDDESGARSFGMRVVPGSGCILLPNANASVTFIGGYGNAGASGALYALQPGGAKGLALVIKDDAGSVVEPGVTSKQYALGVGTPKDMLFSAALRATAATVSPGPATTDLRFSVDIH